MTRTSDEGKKRRLVKKANAGKIDKKMKKKIKKTKVRKALPLPEKDESPIASESDSDSDLDVPDSGKIQKLLEPYTKDQLIDFIIDAAIKDDDLFNRIRDAADHDVSHRKIFVYGLGWDTTREILVSAFESYGEIEDCTVVTDRVTGKAKGFGFVLFKSRKAAMKALKEPRKKIKNRMVSFQLASLGSVAAQQIQESTGRKIYVSNVQPDTDPEKLRAFFEKFGEIETGPIGFDMHTGKSRGFALFVYKTQEGAKKVLQEPDKIFEGHQLHCQFASQGKSKGATASITTAIQPVQMPPSLAAVAAAQNMAMLSNYPNLNPMFGGFIGNQNAGFLSPSAVNQSFAQGVMGASQLGQLGNAGGYGGLGSHGINSLPGNQSLIGSYSTSPMLQGLQHAYPPSSQIGKPSTSRGSGSISGYPSYLWYDLFNPLLLVHVYDFLRTCFSGLLPSIFSGFKSKLVVWIFYFMICSFSFQIY